MISKRGETSRARLLVLSLALAAAGCADQAGNPAAPAGPSTAEAAGPVAQGPDAPWRRMSDAELTDATRRAGGRVFIGLKEPGAARGVDARGRALVSPATLARAKQELRARGLRFEREFQFTPTVVAVVPEQMVPLLRRLPFVDNVEPIFPGEWLQQSTPWNVTRLASSYVWPSSTGSGVKLLVIDSGISSHEDLSWTARTRCTGYTDDDLNGHGTFVAGVVRASNNSIGVVGNSPGVSLYAVKVGDATPDPAATACAVEYGRNQGVFVMTMSLSFPAYENLTAQIAGAYNEGRLLVASAGNTNGGAVTYPATLSQVIAVGATTSSNARAAFSAVGSKVELVAPGDDVYSTTPMGGGFCQTTAKYGTCDGTSFAAPAVAAVAALTKGVDPTLTNVQVRDRMNSTATDLGTPGRDSNFGYGMVWAPGAARPLMAHIDGPGSTTYEGTWTWEAFPSNGTGSYTYQWSAYWYRSGGTETLGTDKTQSLYVVRDHGSFDLMVTVSSGGVVVHASKSVCNFISPTDFACD